MSSKDFLDVDIVEVESDRANLELRIKKALKEYQQMHGPIAIDQLDIIQQRHSSPHGVLLSLLIRKKGAATSNQDKSLGQKGKSDE